METTSATLSDEIREVLEKILNKQIKNENIEILGTSEKGDNYLGDITFVRLNGENKIDLVLKCAKKSKELREAAPVGLVFENEIYVYDVIMKHFFNFQIEKGLEPCKSIPKFYGYYDKDPNEFIVMENLKCHGYRMHNRKVPMDFPYIKLVLEAYAKWHAISYALNDQKPDCFKKISDGLLNIAEAFRKNKSLDDFFNINAKMALEWVGDHISEHHRNKFLDMLTDMQEYMDSINNAPLSPYDVISHGDCWNNNFLFKVENGDPVDVKILDWQISKRTLPVFDLAYFLTTCISEKDILDIDNILKIYYNALEREVALLGSNLKNIYPYDIFIEHWRKNVKFGLFMAYCIVKVCLLENDETFDLAEVAEPGENPVNSFLVEIKDKEAFVKRILPILNYFIRENLF